MAKNRKCVYLPDHQIKWLREMAEINMRSESFFVQRAIDCLAELLGGYGDEN